MKIINVVLESIKWTIGIPFRRDVIETLYCAIGIPVMFCWLHWWMVANGLIMWSFISAPLFVLLYAWGLFKTPFTDGDGLSLPELFLLGMVFVTGILCLVCAILWSHWLYSNYDFDIGWFSRNWSMTIGLVTLVIAGARAYNIVLHSGGGK